MSDVYEVLTDDMDNPVIWAKADSEKQIRDAYDGFGTKVISIHVLAPGCQPDDDLTAD